MAEGDELTRDGRGDHCANVHNNLHGTTIYRVQF